MKKENEKKTQRAKKNNRSFSGLTLEQLQKKKAELQRDLFSFRMQKGFRQLGQTHVLKETRRDIARVNTAIQQKGT